MSKRYTKESFISAIKEINPGIEVLSPFTKVVDRVDVRCIKCGLEWSPKAYSLLQGKGCPHCSAVKGANNKGRTARKTKQQFIEELRKITPTITVIGEYVNNKTKIAVRCNICKTEWSAVPNSLLFGHGCPRCAKSGTSFMEQFILRAFRYVLGDDAVLSRDKETIGMELDIVVPAYKFAVEPGNWFLHSRSHSRDAKKREKCQSVGMRLITIYDQCPSGTVSPFQNDCMLFNIDLNSGNHSELKKLTIELLHAMNVDVHITDDEWKKIEIVAAAASRAQTHEDFVKKLYQINPDVEAIDCFINVNTRMHVRCRKCNNEWNAIPAQLLSGYGCRKCGTEKAHLEIRKTQAEFVKQMSDINPNIEVIGKYKSRHKKVLVRCKHCGNEWNADAGSLLSRRGCPKCSRKMAANQVRKSHDIYVNQLREVNPSIEVIGKYAKNHEPIEVKCRICDNIWAPIAGSLLRGQGCPICGRKRAAERNKRKVFCVETGVVFPSATDAAKALGLKSSSSIIQAIKKGGKSGGYHWMYENDSKKDNSYDV